MGVKEVKFLGGTFAGSYDNRLWLRKSDDTTVD